MAVLVVSSANVDCGMIINVISSPIGGGAELLVRELHRIYLSQKLDSHVIYSVGDHYTQRQNETVFGLNPRSPFNILKIRKVLKQLTHNKKSPCVVHIHLTWPFFYGTLACLGLNNIKLIYTEHDTLNKRRNVPLLWIIERLFYSQYECIVCISDGVKKSLENWVGSKISQRLVTIPNGSRIYSLIERTALEGRLPRLISVGSLSSKKNFTTTISAIALLRDEVESYTIIGEGPERPLLEKLIQEKKLENKVKLIGWSDEIEAHLHAADIQLIPSLWEGFGLVAVEGMSTGLPVVASNVDGLREVIDESNPSVTLVNQPGSVNEWVTCIRVMVKNIYAIGLNKIAITSRQQAEMFSLDEMADHYLAIYLQVLSEQRH